MGCFTSLLVLLVGFIYFTTELRPIMHIEGFWMLIGIIWFGYFISWLLIGDLADEIAGVEKED